MVRPSVGRVPDAPGGSGSRRGYPLRRAAPLYVFFELTRKCNLSCKHCYIVREDRPELSSAAVKQVIDQLQKAGVLLLNFSGGEVLARHDFFEIAAYARRKHFAIKVFSNGTLIDAAAARVLAGLRPVRVEITLLGPDAATHDAIAQKRGAFAKTLSALWALKKKGVRLRIKMPLLKDNFGGYRRMLTLARGMDIPLQIDPLIVPRLDGSPAPLQMRLGSEELRAFFSDPQIASLEKIDRAKRVRLFPGMACSAGHTSCALSAYGDVFPCVVVPEKMGSVPGQDFSRLWQSSAAMRYRAESRRLLTGCRGCRHDVFCGRCPGVSYLERGALAAFSPRLCLIASIKAQCAAAHPSVAVARGSVKSRGRRTSFAASPVI